MYNKNILYFCNLKIFLLNFSKQRPLWPQVIITGKQCLPTGGIIIYMLKCKTVAQAENRV